MQIKELQPPSLHSGLQQPSHALGCASGPGEDGANAECERGTSGPPSGHSGLSWGFFLLLLLPQSTEGLFKNHSASSGLGMVHMECVRVH